MDPANAKGQTKLKAHYASPDGTKTFVHPLNAPQNPESTKEKTAHLSALRTSVTKLQEEVNVFLTQKMEEDKAMVSDRGGKVDDKQDEDNYGEELVDETA